jgi:hypothetical protein
VEHPDTLPRTLAPTAVGRAGWPYLLLALVVGLVRWPTLSNQFFSIDEADYFAQAARLRSLSAFVYAFYYRTETKSQVGLLPYLLAAALDRPNAVLLLNIFGLLAVLISCWLLVAFARRFLGGALPGLAAALLWLPFLEIGRGYGDALDVMRENYIAPNLEYFQTPCILASLYGVAWGVRNLQGRAPHAGRPLFAAGIALALAALVKPSVLVLVPLYALYIGVAALRAAPMPAWRDAARPALGAAAGFLGGVILPPLLLFLPYLFNPPALAELKFNLIDVNTVYVGDDPLLLRIAGLLLGMPPLLLLSFVGLTAQMLVARARRGPGSAPGALPLVVLTGLGVFVGSLPGHFYWHYLVPIIALLALSVTGYLAGLLRRRATGGRTRSAWAVTSALAILYFAVQIPAWAQFAEAVRTDRYLADDRLRFDLDGVLTYIETHTAPTSAIWVYYNTPELYLWSNRYPATRDPFAEYLAIFWAEPWFSRAAQDLAAEQPDLVVEIRDPRYARPLGGPLAAMPQVGALLAQAYHCDAIMLRGATLCTRIGASP